MLEKMFPKIASVPYTTDPANFTSECVHWKIPSGENCPADQFVKPYPKSTLSKHWPPYLTSFDGEPFEMEWQREIMPQIAGQMVISVMLALDKPLSIDSFIKGKKKEYKRFLHLSPDFTLDGNGKVWMIEMNTNGFMIGDRYSKYIEAQDDTVNELRLVGADGYKKQKEYSKDMRDVVNAFCMRFGHDICEASGRQMLRELMNEEHHANGWRRIFPHSSFTTMTHNGPHYPVKKKNSVHKEELPEFRHEGLSNNEVYQHFCPHSPGRLNELQWQFLEARKKIIQDLKLTNFTISEDTPLTV
mmetsp:Transcript_27596/g.35647  ORF Transcript_27596/g.35647 Transcript_27596/m.35647 type:complete len:301 (-) Transcript_27596:14-916(-)